jgi:hypothetical protein
MPKTKPQKRPQGGKPGTVEAKKAASGFSRHLPIIVLGIALQLALPWAYYTFFAPTEPAAAVPVTAEPKRAAAATPAVCPDDWAECPRVGGVDWVAMLELQGSADLQQTAALGSSSVDCSPDGMLSPQAVPGMHLFCVLPPPEGAAGVRQMLVGFKDMLRGQTPRATLVPAALKSPDQLIAVCQLESSRRRVD